MISQLQKKKVGFSGFVSKRFFFTLVYMLLHIVRYNMLAHIMLNA